MFYWRIKISQLPIFQNFGILMFVLYLFLFNYIFFKKALDGELFENAWLLNFVAKNFKIIIILLVIDMLNYMRFKIFTKKLHKFS